MTIRDETAAQRVARPAKTPRIQPPPRPGRRPPAGPDPLTLPAARRLGPAAGEHGGHGWMWLTVALFGVLAVAAIGVFFVLPDWVRARQELAPASVAGAAAAPAVRQARAADFEADAESPDLAAAAAAGDEIEAESPAEPEPRETARTAGAAPQRPAPAAAPASGRGATPAGRRGDAFAEAMSEGLAALDREDYAAAREAFSRAAGERPGSTQSADGLARAEAALRLAEVTRLRDEAAAFEAREDWKAAAKSYGSVLELDPTIGFAQEGQARSGARADLADRLGFHVANPHRLSADEVLREASGILAEASAIDPAGPRHAGQVAALAAHVAAYSTPVRAVLESDELTDVTVYKVGRLGTFRRHALDLRPGTYTVVGSRRGYRDVRRQLVIAPGAAPAPLAVRCEEEI